VFEEAGEVRPRLVEMRPEDLSPGDVVVRVRWSGINYKDALAITGRGKILKRFPLNAGIDAAGTVESSSDDRFRR
jgi:NADPH2:quinone reductase